MEGGDGSNKYSHLRYVDPDISAVIWMLMYSVAIYILIKWLLYLLRTMLAIGFGVVDVIFSNGAKDAWFGPHLDALLSFSSFLIGLR